MRSSSSRPHSSIISAEYNKKRFFIARGLVHCEMRMTYLPFNTAKDVPGYSTALTIASITFLASPNTIIVFGW
jgi:hypothetical protein